MSTRAATSDPPVRHGHVFIAQGDITRLSAHVVVYSTDRVLSHGGQLTSAFESNVAGFRERYRALRDEHRASGKTLDPGDAFWMERDVNEHPRGVVVAVAAAGRLPRGERAFLAAKGALECASANLERLGVAPAWLIALPCLLAGDGGGRHDRGTVAEKQIEAAELFVRGRPHVDVAFIAFTEANYQVWLRARRSVRERLALDDSIPPRSAPQGRDPEVELVGALQRGECVIFAGSGMSTRTGLPSWGELVGELADRLGVPEDRRRTDLEYLLDLAQWYRNAGLSPSIEELVAARFTAASSGAKPTLAQYLTAALPARYFVTTNYDDLLDTALFALRRQPSRIVEERDVPKTGSHRDSYIVKLHGCAARGGHVVLSRDDYDDYFRTRPAMSLLLEGLLLNQSFFFLGYSLRDPDFRQLWSRIDSMVRESKRPAFATTFEDPGPLARDQWKRKNLLLLEVPGANMPDKSRALDLFLDRLAELVSLDPHLFLAEDVDSSREGADVRKVRDKLLSLAPDLAGACLGGGVTTRSDALALAGLVRFYASHGWRGTFPGQLSAVFRALAMHEALLDEERRELYSHAMRFSESSDDVKRVELAIRALDRRKEKPAG